jgi:succinate dehydrogenase / fumarate reductase flavoprotein subunit
MGGIPTNYHGEVVRLKDGDPDSVVPGLFAIGEAACVSVHGANRLGSNSLLDLIVFGRAVAHRCAEVIQPNQRHDNLDSGFVDALVADFDRLRFADGKNSAASIRDDMQQVMQNNAAVFRTGEVLEEGCKLITDVYADFADRKAVVHTRGRITPTVTTMSGCSTPSLLWIPAARSISISARFISTR